ncbi:hypothetical protein [Morganella morganii]|uniref:hypothetical protein n=1 Tax=Morganella morganii TaxID=582 RepID=UPI0030FF0EDB
MGFDYKKERVNCHNDFPKRILFETETKFEELIDRNHGLIPFTPIKIDYNDNVIFQTCIGHLIDGLDFLPFRPDHMFDNCFKVIDKAGRAQSSSSTGIKGVVQGIGNKLLNLPNNCWGDIIDLLSSNIPISIIHYIVKRIFESESFRLKGGKRSHGSWLANRTECCFHPDQYNEFIKKFAFDSNGTISLDKNNLLRATGFLTMILKGHTGSKVKDPAFPLLDLSVASNHFPQNKKCEFISSILLYNMRNERAHGSTLSPFRSSKSTISRYEGYYYSMLCAYIISLGTFELNKFGGFSSKEVYDCCRKNINMIRDFFKIKN